MQPHGGPAATDCVESVGQPQGGGVEPNVPMERSSVPQVRSKTVTREADQKEREGSVARWIASAYVTPLATASATYQCPPSMNNHASHQASQLAMHNTPR